VGDVDHRRFGHLFLQLRDLDPGGDAQRGVEVRQRLVEEIDLGVAHDGPADGDPLPLTARQRLGQAVEEVRQLQLFGRRAHLPVDLSLSSPAIFRAKAMLS
jgi:hypothetical protein